MKIERTEPSVLAENQEAYLAFPDVIYYKKKFLCVYRESDCHHPTTSKLKLLTSIDGIEWSSSDFSSASLDVSGWVFNCPKFSIVDNKLVLVCDTKTSQSEKYCDWNILISWSEDGDSWTPFSSTSIKGMVPDKIVECTNNKLIMGYHLIEDKRLVQMIASSTDKGITWRDRTTVAESHRHDFCEGSFVRFDKRKILSYMRDNKGVLTRSQCTVSVDNGLTWSVPTKININGHRIVAKPKLLEPYKNVIIGTYRNTSNKNVSLFVHNLQKAAMQTFNLDSESHDSMFDFGYSGWTENEHGQILVVYYIRRHKQNPVICSTLVTLK